MSGASPTSVSCGWRRAAHSLLFQQFLRQRVDLVEFFFEGLAHGGARPADAAFWLQARNHLLQLRLRPLFSDFS